MEIYPPLIFQLNCSGSMDVGDLRKVVTDKESVIGVRSPSYKNREWRFELGCRVSGESGVVSAKTSQDRRPLAKGMSTVSAERGNAFPPASQAGEDHHFYN